MQAQQKTMCSGARTAAKLCARWDTAEGNAALALVVAGVFGLLEYDVILEYCMTDSEK